MDPKPDVFGQALWEHYKGHNTGPLLLHSSYGSTEEMAMEVFFRTPENFPELERIALKLCRGKVLDIGAGAGSHALALEKSGVDVTALDHSMGAVRTMQERGVMHVALGQIQSFKSNQRFDTLLLLMNGIGLAGELIKLRPLLWLLKSFLNPSGQLLFDSCDITYLYREHQIPHDRYYGEVDFCYEYKNTKGAWFRWLYLDQQTLKREARAAGWKTEIIYQDDLDQYLAKLTSV